MKKLFFTFIMLLVSTVVLAQDGTTPVVVIGESVPGHNRSGIGLPIVTYSSNSNTLTVEFESEDSYELIVKDIYGTTWYSGPVNTSGAPTDYYMNLQPNNTYIVSISSSNDLFYGVLVL